MIQQFKRLFICFLLMSFTSLGFTQSVQAAMISTEQALATTTAATAQQNRDKLAAALARPDVTAELERLGVAKSEAEARVAALSDAEVATLAGRVDSLPAGGDILGTIVFIFVLLLVTDILGLTKVYPFTRSVR